jgi:hypothetical protein
MKALLLIGMPGVSEYAMIAIMLLLPLIALFDILKNECCSTFAMSNQDK